MDSLLKPDSLRNIDHIKTGKDELAQSRKGVGGTDRVVGGVLSQMYGTRVKIAREWSVLLRSRMH